MHFTELSELEGASRIICLNKRGLFAHSSSIYTKLSVEVNCSEITDLALSRSDAVTPSGCNSLSEALKDSTINFGCFMLSFESIRHVKESPFSFKITQHKMTSIPHLSVEVQREDQSTP